MTLMRKTIYKCSRRRCAGSIFWEVSSGASLKDEQKEGQAEARL